MLGLGSGYHTKTALHADGSISAWGHNAAGQLGTGFIAHKDVPVALGVPLL